MGKTRKTTKKQNRVDASNNGGAPWLDLDHHVLRLVMMRLGVVDFLAFGEVCKPWRSLALSNRNMFMESKPPMSIWISGRTYKKSYYCYLEDFEGRRFKTLLPPSGGGRTCVGLTCGYLVLFGRKTRDFWLVNPITSHELRFPGVSFYNDVDPEEGVRAMLVFLPSISRWVFVVLCRYTHMIWFYIAGKEAWDYVFSDFPILDLHDFKGKIYTIGIQGTEYRLSELKLDPKPKLTFLKTKNFPDPGYSEFMGFVCLGENLYVMELEHILGEELYEVHELDFAEMKWVLPDKKTMEEHAFFASEMKHNNGAIKRELWSDSWLPFKRYFSNDNDTIGNDMFFSVDLWYFPHDCSNVNFTHQ